jgi:hypothetical protein
VAQSFPRWLGSVDDLPAGMFTLAESKRIALSCPQCSTVFELPAGCGPDQAGRSVYAVHCAAQNCGFWDFAVFEACWEPR